MSILYRDYSCTLTANNCKRLLQSLAMTKGVITCNFTIGIPKAKDVHYFSMFYRLRFPSQKHLDAFHELGFETKEPAQISPQFPTKR